MAELAVDVEGRRVVLSTLDRLMWPLTGTTKAELVDYYARIGDVLLPHVAGRPVTLRRFPEGIEGPGFFQTRCPPHPEWVRTTRLSFPRTGKAFDAAVVDDLASLVWAANLSSVEIHPFLHCADEPDRPSYVVFDLDPGPPAGLIATARVALAVHDLLVRDGLVSYVKSSGAKGLHVCVPLNSDTTYAGSKRYARAIAATLSRQREDVVDTMTKSLRAGKVFVDWSQNDPGKSTVAPYSLRALRVPTVAAPLTWEEVAMAAERDDPRPLVHGINTVFDRVNTLGDLFAPVLTERQRLPAHPGRTSRGSAR